MKEQKAQYLDDEHGANMVDVFTVLAKHKWLVIYITIGAVIFTAVISMFMPSIYLAETKFFIPSSNTTSFSAQLINEMTPIATLIGGVNLAGAGSVKNNLYIEMLKSRSVRDRIIDRFDLMKGKENKAREEVREALLMSMQITTDNKSGILVLGIEDKNPQRAAAMANAFIEELLKLNKNLALTEVSQRRLFLEEQLKEAKEAITKAEDAIKVFQGKTGVLMPDAQTVAEIEEIFKLRAQIAAKETQIKAMRSYFPSQNSSILRAGEELERMREQVRVLESKNIGDGFMVPTGKVTPVTMEYVRKLRDLKYADTLYELLQGQYQSVRLDEARDAMVVQVLEKAEPPVNASKPARIVMILFAFIIGLAVSLCAVIVIEHKQKIHGEISS